MTTAIRADIMELVIGLEPIADWLQINCAANCATPAFIFKFSKTIFDLDFRFLRSPSPELGINKKSLLLIMLSLTS